MSQYITLLGSEDVSRASHNMQAAADSFTHAVNNLSAILEQHQRFLDDWLVRADGLAQDRISDLGVTLA